MRLPFQTPIIVTATFLVLGVAAYAASNRVSIQTQGDMRCIQSNSLPDHATGSFPNRGNPHRIQAQNISTCLPANPVKGDRAQKVGTIGIATNGVIIRPGTADWYDARSPRGFSRDRSSGWNLEAMGSGVLGLDAQNAHVDNRGIYHYHGVPAALTTANAGTLIGWAADGFEIHYAGTSARPSYQLKPGRRASAPGGTHDGTYHQDYEYIRGLGNLDECNGATVNGRYVYFATDAYPFFPNCLKGTRIARIN